MLITASRSGGVTRASISAGRSTSPANRGCGAPIRCKRCARPVLTAETPAETLRLLAEAYAASRRWRHCTGMPALSGAQHECSRCQCSAGTPDAVLNALPHPVIIVAADGKIADANAAAENFFEASVAAAAPAPAARPRAVRQPAAGAGRAGARARRAGQRIPRRPVDRRAIRANSSSTSMSRRCPSVPGHVVVMLQERTIADKMDRQLTHRGAARSVTGAGRHAGA